MKKASKHKRPQSKKRGKARKGGALPAHASAGTVASKAGQPVKRVAAEQARRAVGRSGRADVQSLVFDRGWREDRLALALMLAPFLIVAFSLGAEQSIRRFIQRSQLAVAPRAPIVAVSPTAPQPAKPAPVQTTSLSPPPPPVPLAKLELMVEQPAPILPMLSLMVEAPAADLGKLALLVEPQPPALPPLTRLAGVAPPPAICLAPAASMPLPSAVGRPADPAAFGLALADAALAQLKNFVIYNPKYVSIRYPMGDVAPLFGVCTDVVVRAYRALGIDLQALIQETRSGRGDRNIDHRRVEVVRGFLARYGQKLPVTDMAEDYQPGDLVSYHRPQNHSTTSHIAIVTDRIAPSGRPMIVHNRGWGPELEDALFVDTITGHYRFTGLAEAAKPVAAPPKTRRVAQK